MQLFKKETYFYILVFLLIVLSSFSLGYKNLVIDFFNGSIISYRSQTLQRIALIQKMKREGKEDIVVPSFQNPSKSIGVDFDDTSAGKNQANAYRVYFELKSIQSE